MRQQEIHQFLERYFTANDCSILANEAGYLTVQLTIDMDKELMNRPFYWHYLEKTGGQPNPAQLTLITNPNMAPEHIKGEIIHFGSPRLHQLFQSSKNLSRYIRLYEQSTNASQNKQIQLKPWLCMNIKISYQCDRKKDILRSLGLQLITGKMVDNFYDHLQNMELTAKIPDYSFTLSPLIKTASGVTRMENKIRMELEQEDDTWAIEARQRWKKDLDLLEHFYEDMEDKTESYEKEKLALQDQYEPKINISIINGGLFYLQSDVG